MPFTGRVVGKELSVEQAVGLVEILLSSGLELHEPPGLHGRALELAGLLQQGAAYDGHYLALAETLNLRAVDRRREILPRGKPGRPERPLDRRARHPRLAPGQTGEAAERAPFGYDCLPCRPISSAGKTL